MAYENLLIEREDKVAVITINRPKVLNALNDAVMAELDRALDELGADDGVRVIIITGAGDKAFVAGADIGELNALPNPKAGIDKSWRGMQVLFKIEKMPKPVIMAINGFALGGGCELAMAGDIRIAADTAKLGQPEISLGIIPGYGGTQRLPRLVGKGTAKMLLFTGDMIDAQEAWRIGLVDKVVPAAELMDYVKGMAKKMAEKAPIALGLIKDSVNAGLEMDLERGCLYEATNFGIICSTEDKNEGTSAFLEKRKPIFKGK